MRSFKVATWLLERSLRKLSFRLFASNKYSNPYLSQADYKACCMKEYNPRRSLVVGPYDIIHLNLLYLREFAVFSRTITNPYVLVSSGSDNQLSHRLFSQVDSEHLIHWFSQNANVASHKVTCLPIGLEDCSLQTNGIVSFYNKIRSDSLVMQNKSPTILYGFNPDTNPAVRNNCLSQVIKHPLALNVHALPRDYINSLAQSMFVVSPAGNGLDCHRTWEALYLNTIPIVQGRSFYNQFPGFPGIVLDSWDELNSITHANVIERYHHCLERLRGFELIYFDYWKRTISSFASADAA